jgi:hypothetical protein
VAKNSQLGIGGCGQVAAGLRARRRGVEELTPVEKIVVAK